MKSRFFVPVIVLVTMMTLVSAWNVYSYPWFARRLVDSCNKCHVSFPKTNDYGWYVKSTGYELPQMDYTGLEESPVKRFLRYLPAAMRFKMDAINSNPSDIEGDINFREVQLISGGSILNNRVSWWFHKHLVEDNNFVSLLDGTPHEMWAQYNIRFGKSNVNRLGIRYGMAELPLRFSPSKTKISEVGYAIYTAMMGSNSFTLSTPQYGIMLNGLRLGGASFNEVKSNISLALVNGQGDFKSNKFNQFFGRVGTTVVKNTMVGAFTYIGSLDLPMAMETDGHGEGHGDEHGEEPGTEHSDESSTTDNNFFRVGMDFDMVLSPKINLYGLALYGKDSNPAGLEIADSGNFYGGFLGLDFTPNERFMLSWRYDAVRFNSVPEVGHNDEHGDGSEDMHMDEGGDDHSEGEGNVHMHGEMVMSNTDCMVFGLQLLPIPKFYQLRLTAEYRMGINGLDNLLIAGLQFAL